MSSLDLEKTKYVYDMLRVRIKRHLDEINEVYLALKELEDSET